MRIAYLCAENTLPGSPNRRSDAFEHDLSVDGFRKALEPQHSLDAVRWDDASQDWSVYDAAVIGTAWDYWDRAAEFVTTLTDIAEQTALFNAPDVIAWNFDKQYLRALAQAGVPTIPTVWLATADEGSVNAAYSALDTTDIVAKRQVGAGADGQFRLHRGDPVPAMPHAMMVQPFLETIQTEGEMSFIFIDGALSHTLVKQAKNGEYRIQSMYGGVEHAIEPAAADKAAAAAVIDTLDHQPLYARVDMVRGNDGGLLLMELEMIEPYLYPVEGPEVWTRMVKGLERRLGTSQ